MNNTVTIPDTWQDKDFNEWINKIYDYVRNNKNR
tara:strand:+ start:574 stop:675 length:102 start_codon:yes stop_codon:yes gene_type:complete